MNNVWLFIMGIITESWFWQGIIINITFSLATIPFTNKTVQKNFRNRKKNRINSACNELKTYCLQHLIKDKHVNKDDFENQLYIIANRYKLDVKDIYNDKKAFGQNLVHTILEIDLIDNYTKEKIIDKIRKDKIFIESENSCKNYNSTLDKETDCSNEYNNEDVIQLNKNERKDIIKYTIITTGIIFISLLLYTFLSQVLIEAYGVSSNIFVNTIIIVIATIPILVNGIIHFSKFNEQNKIYFGLLLLISILNIINFICIVGILLYER